MTRQLQNAALIAVFILTSALASAAQTCGATEYDCQIRLYSDQIKANARDYEAYYNLATAYQGKGDYAASIAPLDTYITSGATKPEYIADGYNRRGFARKKMDQDDLAVKDYTMAIGLFPKPLFYNNRGDSYATLKQFDLAIADHTKAINMDPKYTSAYFARGFAYMGQKNYSTAIVDFTKVLSLNPEDGEAYYNRGTAYYELQKYQLAIADLTRYIELNRSVPNLMADGYMNRGLAYAELGNMNNAIEDFTGAIVLAPDMKKAYTNRAKAYRKQGKIAEAIADEKKAAAL